MMTFTVTMRSNTAVNRNSIPNTYRIRVVLLLSTTSYVYKVIDILTLLCFFFYLPYDTRCCYCWFILLINSKRIEKTRKNSDIFFVSNCSQFASQSFANQSWNLTDFYHPVQSGRNPTGSFVTSNWQKSGKIINSYR
jgi:hypothetical protein